MARPRPQRNSTRNPAIAAVAVLLLLSGAALADGPAGVPVVRVNDHVITEQEIDRFVRVAEGQGAAGAQSGEDVLVEGELRAQKRQAAAKALIERWVLFQEARDAYLDSATSKEVLDSLGEDALDKLQRQAGSRLEASQVLARLGLTPDEYKEFHAQTVLTAKLLWDRAYSLSRVAPGEERDYYAQHPELFGTPKTVTYRQIILTVVDEADEAEQRARAAELLRQLEAGEGFAGLADRFSDDRELHPGGLRTVRIPESRPDWMPPAVRGLDPGQLSGVRRLSAGFSVALLEEVKEPDVQPFEDVQDRIRDALLTAKRAAARAELVAELTAEADIEYLAAAEPDQTEGEAGTE